ncbi:Ammonia channel [Planktothrix tepida]|uniref:Ammonium transporter n=2 Tax=Planktothrix TaxID=54304 RepID=A0A1J1LRA4_9CYAN|nr:MULTISPECIES: ammonium transporter [Planktothrix]CAD5936251.1 Ammonia channel [Planktothrix pseudagardhii]CAD5974001.1 Ammonia channel [Planktothrix tepida]CUR34380.1 ammonium transport protein (Amt family) [Planktothrix tepida PCC 9214]
MLKKLGIIGLVAFALLVGPLTGTAWAQEAAENPINSGDTAFMLVSAALVLFMTPGLAFFYGGLVRSRNVLNTMMMSFILMGIVGVTWVFWGYSLAFDVSTPVSEGFGQGIERFIGGLDWAFLHNVAADAPDPIGYAGTIPHQLFMVYQMMFAIITPALICGAIVERMTFKAYFWFVLLWSTFVYSPLAHWVWGRGWLQAIGALDFAGGTVVHISSGVSAVILAWMIGSRKHFMVIPHVPHNVPFVLLGIGMLWFGWFGFNAGSALSSGSLATVAFVATMVSTSAGGLTWALVEWYLRGKPTAVGIASGFLAGLVGITPAAGFVTPVGAILIGSITAVCCFYAVSWRVKLQFDDSLDTYSVHGVGGTIGAILTGVFATKSVNPAGFDGVVYGNPGQLIPQIVGVLATYIFAAVGTFVIVKILASLMELRVKSMVEEQGLDVDQHGEEAYGEDFASGLSFATETFSRKEG